jgi:hypothetical protein
MDGRRECDQRAESGVKSYPDSIPKFRNPDLWEKEVDPFFPYYACHLNLKPES